MGCNLLGNSPGPLCHFLLGFFFSLLFLLIHKFHPCCRHSGSFGNNVSVEGLLDNGNQPPCLLAHLLDHLFGGSGRAEPSERRSGACPNWGK